MNVAWSQTGYNILAVYLFDCDSLPIINHPVYFKGDTLGASSFYYYDTIYTDINGIAADTVPAPYGESTWYNIYFETPNILPDTGTTSNSFLNKGSGNQVDDTHYWDCASGVNEYGTGQLLTWPNPFTDFILIDKIPVASVECVIADAYGRILFRKPINSAQERLNVSPFLCGSYLLLLKDINGAIIRHCVLLKN